MVTCKVDTLTVSKMNSIRTRKPSSSHSSGFRLLDGDHLEAASSVSKNSIYKLKIDLMFDDSSRSVRSNHRLDDPHGSHRTRSIIMYGRSELASTVGESTRSITSFVQDANGGATKKLPSSANNDVERMSNTVQAQIEQLFTDVAKDATSSFAVTYLGSLPLKDKVTSLQGLQDPLRQLYLKEQPTDTHNSGFLDICATGLRVKINTNGTASQHDSNKNNNDNNGSTNISNSDNERITPFHNIAVWSAVKFVVSTEDGGAAFLPLITDPENIDKSSLFQPLTDQEQKHVTDNTHAPIFAVVMRSADLPKTLECHGFICKSTEDAIVIAATLYKSLMAHVNSNSHRNTKRRTPRNQNGVSCISIASSSAQTGSNYLSRSQVVSNGRKSSFRSTNGSIAAAPPTTRSVRKKRISNLSLSSSSNIINEGIETTTEERKRKSHKTRRAPPVPISSNGNNSKTVAPKGSDLYDLTNTHLENHTSASKPRSTSSVKSLRRNYHQSKKSSDSVYRASEMIGGGAAPALVAAAVAATTSSSGIRTESSGDILTRVAIPRSGSFLNTGGLTRYKSRAARRNSGKLGGSGSSGGGGVGCGGGGSPLGFSELFNEFRLHENLNSLDEILYAIIDADGMSFNDLKPIYKEFLLKLAVTLTKDELFQRSKNIMRRQKKKKLKRRTNSNGSQKKPRTLLFGTKNLKKVFQLGHFRSCRGKPPKPPRNKEAEVKHESSTPTQSIPQTHSHMHQQRSRVATSGSDVSVIRHDTAFHGPNRNSSSGYVSCSECSYDSEACTCTSADRCYCSLRAETTNSKLRHKNERNVALSKRSTKNNNEVIYISGGGGGGGMATNRHSLISCKSDDKCYCSMVEEEDPTREQEDESTNTHSDTTWCDTDSCISNSKCYCKRSERRAERFNADQEPSQHARRSRSISHKRTDKMGLDYELFTIDGNGKSVQPCEALSMKKSVEAAAIFADVKLSQTTDIKSMCSSSLAMTKNNIVKVKHGGNCPTEKCGSSNNKTRSSAYSIGRRNEHNAAVMTNSSQKSSSADDLLNKLKDIERTHISHAAAVAAAVSHKNGSHRSRAPSSHCNTKSNFRSNYQSMRAVSSSLEDTLGYLP